MIERSQCVKFFSIIGRLIVAQSYSLFYVQLAGKDVGRGAQETDLFTGEVLNLDGLWLLKFDVCINKRKVKIIPYENQNHVVFFTSILITSEPVNGL